MKSLSKTLLGLYLLFLLWLILFKSAYNPVSVLLHYQTRSLNLIPFADYSRANVREMIDNFAVFIPFGLLLSVNLKRTGFWRKLAYVFMFSLGAEVAQFVFAIGAMDITDVIMNTIGGFLGLALYDVVSKVVDTEDLDWLIVMISAILLVGFLYLRIFVFRVRY